MEKFSSDKDVSDILDFYHTDVQVCLPILFNWLLPLKWVETL